MIESQTQGELIAAVATPPGQGGVGIVRLSGAGALAVAAQLIDKPLPPRVAVTANFTVDGEVVDQGIAIAFVEPNSFTGEDVVELHCHGSPVVLQRMLDVVCARGARIARPGEFSERAFLNEKIDLAQAEAVADLIASASVTAARAAVRSLQGVFSARVQDINEGLERTRILLEASIDFPEEEQDFLAAYDIPNTLKRLRQDLAHLLTQAQQGQVYRDGCSVALIGPPNAGKSSLLNVFSGEETAIVTDIPGTTRDLLKVDLVLDGLPVRMIDTAGLRPTADVVERKGIERALAQVGQADVVVLLADGAEWDSVIEQTEQTLALAEIKATDSRVLRAVNKCDLLDDEARSSPADEVLWVSAKTGVGLSGLAQQIAKVAGVGAEEVAFTARARHVEALIQASEHLTLASQHIEQGISGEVIAEELRTAHHALGEILGLVTADELLGKIFSQFCIGK